MQGVRFDFGNDEKPFIINWGDELEIGLEFPPGFISENPRIMEVRVQNSTD